MLRIVAPHFVAGWSPQRVAPILAYMRGWPTQRVQRYCRLKGWQCERVDTRLKVPRNGNNPPTKDTP